MSLKEVFHIPVDLLAEPTEPTNAVPKQFVDDAVNTKADKSAVDTLTATVNDHATNKANPHGVTPKQIGAATTAVATASADGLMSKSDKAKLDGMSSSSLMRTFTATITANGTTKEWSLKHNIGTTNVIVQAFDATGNPCVFGVTKVSANEVKLSAAVAPANGAIYSVLIMGTGV